jgi:rhodanese-related sulfurtransferase
MSITASELLTTTPGATIINAGQQPGHKEILGAIRYNPRELLEADHLALPIAHDQAVILYAAKGATDELSKIAAKMTAEGFTRVRIYDGTLDDYEKAGGVTQEPSFQQVIPPSVPDGD